MPSPDDTTRRCTKCKQSFPATLEYFYPQKKGKYGLSSWCKTCHREVNKTNIREWYQENKEHISEYGKQYRADNAEQIAAYNFNYYWNNVERERARSRDKNKRTRPRILQYNAMYRSLHRDVILKQNNDRHAKRMATDPDYVIKVRASSHKRKALLRKSPESFTASDLKAIIAAQTDKRGQLRCWWCGCTIDGTYHLDHKEPLSRGGSNGATNIVVACPQCNLSKHTKTPAEFAGRLL